MVVIFGYHHEQLAVMLSYPNTSIRKSLIIEKRPTNLLVGLQSVSSICMSNI